MYVYRMSKCLGRITWPKHAHAQSQFWAVKIDPCYSFPLYARAALAWMKKIYSLKNEKLKANISETEGKRKERLRIRREKESKRRLKKNDEGRKGRQKQKTTTNNTWPLSY